MQRKMQPAPTPAIAGMIAMATAMGIGRFAYTPILPAMMSGLGLDASQAGLIASANYLGYLAGAVLAAYGWAEGIERRLAVSGLAATALLLAAMAVVDTAWLMAAIRFLAGLASAFVMIFSSAIVLSHGAASGQVNIQSVHFSGVGIGMAVSALAVGTFSLAGADWRWGWVSMAALAGIGLVAVARLLPGGPHRKAGGAPRERPIDWSRDKIAVTLAYGIFGFGYIITATFLVAIVRQGGGSTFFEACVWMSTGAAAAVSVALGQRFVGRFGLRAVFAGGCLVEAAGVAASVLVPSPAGPLIGGLLLGATFVVITAFGLQLGRAMAPESPRRIFAFMTAAFGFGQIGGPVVAGYLADMTGNYTSASLTAAIALVTSAALVQMSKAG